MGNEEGVVQEAGVQGLLAAAAALGRMGVSMKAWSLWVQAGSMETQ